MKYIISKFNWVVPYGDKTIIYNSFTGKILLLKEEMNVYSFLTSNDSLLEEKEIREEFITNGFIIPDQVIEEEVLSAQFKKEICKDELFLVILPTEQCNFRCVYCYELFQRTFLDVVSIESIKAFVDKNLCNYSALKVSWFGGEPLVSFDILEELSDSFIMTCKKYHKPYHSSITTNGSLLRPDSWNRLKHCHITDLQLTLDGLKTTHDKQRISQSGEGTWDKIIENLRYFRDNIHTHTIHIMLRTNITRQIYDMREDYIDFLKKEFGSDKRFHMFFHLVMDWGNIQDETIVSQFCGANEYYEMLELAAECGLHMPIYQDFLKPFSRICFAAKKNAFVITSDGIVRKCTQRLNDAENFVGTFDNSYDFFADNWDFTYKELSDECKLCKKRPLCMGMVCPLYKGPITDTCGTELTDLPRLLRIIVKNEGMKAY